MKLFSSRNGSSAFSLRFCDVLAVFAAVSPRPCPAVFTGLLLKYRRKVRLGRVFEAGGLYLASSLCVHRFVAPKFALELQSSQSYTINAKSAGSGKRGCFLGARPNAFSDYHSWQSLLCLLQPEKCSFYPESNLTERFSAYTALPTASLRRLIPRLVG